MKRVRKAVLLAAGLGTRLRPITLETPKCLVKVKGKALLGHWLERLSLMGIEEVLVNTHYHAEKVEEYVEKWRTKEGNKMTVITVYEKELLDTGGTLMENIDFLTDSSVMIIHADNYIVGSLEAFVDDFIDGGKTISMLLFKSVEWDSCGFVEIDEAGKVIGFTEKPGKPVRGYANGAIYLVDESFHKIVLSHGGKGKNISNDILPMVFDKCSGYVFGGSLSDVGTVEAYNRLNQQEMH